jgi:hypothetical protein
MNSAQKERLIEFLKEYELHPFTGESREESYEEFDQKRASSIPEINKLVADFLSNKIGLSEFKDSHGFKCREFPYWGFKGLSGQMQLNQLVKNVIGDDKELVFRKALLVPKTEKEAAEKIDLFRSYIQEKRTARSAETNALSMPRVASVAYVLSYFWEIQNKSQWPVYYNSSRRVLSELGFSVAEQEPTGQNYVEFVGLINEIARLYKSSVTSAIQNSFWLVEHVLFRRFLKSGLHDPVEADEPTAKSKAESKTLDSKSHGHVASEWLPPVIADLCELSLDHETEWSKRNSLKPEKAFESKIRIAFTLLGFEAVELGQGTGRQPDGFAISQNADGVYAIIYDAKARIKNFSVGTSDREIFEYIKSKSDELKKQRGIMRFYYLIISSAFDENPKNITLIRNVFRQTRIPIVMITAGDLLYLIEEKLKDIELNHTHLEQLFLDTGILTREKIVELLGFR